MPHLTIRWGVLISTLTKFVRRLSVVPPITPVELILAWICLWKGFQAQAQSKGTSSLKAMYWWWTFILCEQLNRITDIGVTTGSFLWLLLITWHVKNIQFWRATGSTCLAQWSHQIVQYRSNVKHTKTNQTEFLLKAYIILNLVRSHNA